MEITFDLLLEIKTKTGAFKEIFLERKKKGNSLPCIFNQIYIHTSSRKTVLTVLLVPPRTSHTLCQLPGAFSKMVINFQS